MSLSPENLSRPKVVEAVTQHSLIGGDVYFTKHVWELRKRVASGGRDAQRRLVNSEAAQQRLQERIQGDTEAGDDEYVEGWLGAAAERE